VLIIRYSFTRLIKKDLLENKIFFRHDKHAKKFLANPKWTASLQKKFLLVFFFPITRNRSVFITPVVPRND
jgi:hypothetical protein